MNFKSTIFMAVVLSLLGTLYYFREKVTAPSDDDLKRPQILKFKADEVSGLDIEGGGKKVVLQKRGKTWYANEPFAGMASRKDIDTLLPALADLKAESIIDESGGNLKAFGLDKPKVTFRVHLSKSKDVPTLVVGDRTQSDNGWYVKTPDQGRVLMASNTLTATILKAPDSWRETAMLGFEPMEVDRVAVDGQDFHLELNKGKDESWKITKPKESKADASQVTTYLTNLKGITTGKFFDQMKPDDAHLRAGLTIKVWPKGERDPLTVVVGDKTEGGYFACRGDKPAEVFLLPDNTLAKIKTDYSTMADRSLFDFGVDKATKADISEASSGDATAEKKDGNWKFTKPADKKDDMGKVTAMLYGMQGLKYERKVLDAAEKDKAGTTFAKPLARFVVYDDKGKKLATLVVGGTTAMNRRYVKINDADDVYVADASFANDWKGIIAGLKPQSASVSPSAAATAAAASPATASNAPH